MEDELSLPEENGQPIDQYLLARLKLQAQLAMAKSLGRMVTGAAVVIGVLYLVANQVVIPAEAWYVIFAVVAGMYGVDGLLTFIQHKK